MKRIIILSFAVITAFSAYSQTYIQDGDRCFDNGDYDCAVTNYNNAFKNSSGRDRQIAEIKLTRAIWCAEHIQTADQAYYDKNYTSAIEEYQKVYDTNPKDEHASDRINLCSKYIYKLKYGPILEKRKTYQHYLNENPEGFSEFRRKNLNVIDKMISELNYSGIVNYITYLQFDTLGNNSSTILINSQSDKKIGTYINESIVSDLLPVTESGFFIPTSDTVFFNASWNTYKMSANYRATKLSIKPLGILPSDINFTINRHINQQSYPNGKYKFEVVKKNLYQSSFIDLNLIRYRNNCGPLNSFYSLIMPGWGTSRVTNGTKGSGRMILFLISSVTCAGSKIYSNIQYDKFRNNIDQPGADLYYNNSNLAHHIFLISGGISASIYIYDFFWVNGKGFKNIHESSGFKRKIKNEPVKILHTPLK